MSTKFIKSYRLFLLFFFLMNVESSVAKQPELYKITFLNTKTIKIGNKVLKCGDKFYDNQIVHWTDLRQMMRVVKADGKNCPEFKMTKHGFQKYESKNVKTLFDYLTQENYLGTRSLENRPRHYSEFDHYLVDTLLFPARNSDNTLRMEAVWNLNGKEIVTPIKTTEDKQFYIISLDIYGKKKPRDIKLGIREVNEDLGWIDQVYRDIPIIFIPKKL